MAAQAGRDIILSLNTTGSTYVAVAGLRARSIRFGNQTIDITNADSAARYRELLGNAGTKTVTISASGVFTDAAIDENLRAMMVNDDLKNLRFRIPSFYEITGLFQITEFEYTGNHDGEVTFTMTAESAGPMTYVAI